MTAWLDNLIPLKAPRLDEHQLAGWQPKAVAMQELGCRILADQRVPVDGGVSLSADVYTSKRPGRYPAIVMFAAYSHELHTAGIPTGSNEIGSPPIFTDRGYAPVVRAASPGRRSSRGAVADIARLPKSKGTEQHDVPAGATELTRLYTEAG